METAHVAAALERWAGRGTDEKWAQEWRAGAIFPREMAFFLAVCEAMGVVNIVESGRHDGYSTELIGRYARARQGLAYSFDIDADRDRAARCRDRLGGNPRLVMIKGNSIGLFGPVLRGDPDVPTAVLIDGPKGYLAISMLLGASGFAHVLLGALHNLNPGSGERRMFEQLGPGPHFYEEMVEATGERWRALGEEEKTVCGGRQEGRSVERSSLGIVVFGRRGRWRRVMNLSPRFGTWQPSRLYLKWRLANTL